MKQRIIMAILKFGFIFLICLSNLEHSFGKPIQSLETLDPKFKDPIDSAIKMENWSSLCDLEFNLNAMRKLLDQEAKNQIDVAKNYIVNQTGENYQEIQNACLHKNVSTKILPKISTTTTEKIVSFL